MLTAVLHTLSIERITCSDCCIWRCDCEGSCFGNDQNLCPCRTIVWATAVTNVAQPSLSQTPQLSTLQPLLSWRQLTHMSSAVSEPATKTGRQQELGIAGPKDELNFFFLCLQNCLTLSCWYSSFYSCYGGQLSFILYWSQAWTEAVCEIVRQVGASTSPVLVVPEYFTDVPLVIC